jgi:hypothetical protein
MTELKYFNNKTPMFSLNGIKTEARVVDVKQKKIKSIFIFLNDIFINFKIM